MLQVSPSTLRSLSLATSNTFKPFSYTAGAQPASLPGPHAGWPRRERGPATRTSLQFHFDKTEDGGSSGGQAEPVIDEAGYASLIARPGSCADPVYEPLRGRGGGGDSVASAAASCGDQLQLYDDVPRSSSCGSQPQLAEHSYANIAACPDPASARTSAASFPDLLQMVAAATPAPLAASTDTLYAKVDLTRKRSRPNSSDSGSGAETVVSNTKNNLDSYTKTLIEKFNLFLEQGGHSSPH